MKTSNSLPSLENKGGTYYISKKKKKSSKYTKRWKKRLINKYILD